MIPRTKFPALAGVGPKGAAALLRRCGTLENAIAEGRFVEQASALRLYKKIATMDPSAPVPAIDDQTPSWDKGAALARHWELDRLADRLEEVSRR